MASSSGLLVLSMDQPGLGLVIWSVLRPSPLPALERLEIKALRASLPPFGATSSHIALGSCGPQPPTRGLSAYTPCHVTLSPAQSLTAPFTS